MFSAILKELFRSNFRSLVFNFRKLPFRQAVRLPIRISSHCLVLEDKGKLVLPEVVSPGMIRIGYGDVGIFDKYMSRTIWEVSGKISFGGYTFLGHGSKISVGKTGELRFGNNFKITAESAIVCNKKISFGDNCLLSWDVLVMDTDFHKIFDEHSNFINPDAEVSVGDNVWIGCRSLILKGSHLPAGCVLAAGSTVSGSYTETNSILGGNPLREIRRNISWKR